MENQNSNQKKSFHRRYNPNFNKPKAVSYLKSFDSFEDGFLEILKFNPELKNYCGDTPIYDNVIAAMMETIKNDMPSPSNPNYPNTLSMSIDSGEVGFKTDINIAVGWRIAYNYHEAKSFYKFRVTFISIPSYKKEVISEMEEAGWSQLDPNHKQKKYWDKVEGKNYKNNKSYNKKKFDNKKDEVPEDALVTEEVEEKDNVKAAFVNPELHEENEEINATEVIKTADEAEKATEEIESKDVISEEDNKEEFVMPKTREEAVKFFAEKDMFHSHQWENPETHKIETITAEEVQKYAGKQNQLVNSITKSSVDGVYVVTHNGVSKVFNINEPNNIPNVLVDKENGVIAFPDGVKFNFNELTVIE